MSESPPASRVLVVWNSKAGNAPQRDAVSGVLRSLEKVGVDVEEHESASADETARLAETAPDEALVVAAGGDGTVHTVAQGIIDRNIPGPTPRSRADESDRRDAPRLGPALGVIPLGTANDFVRSLGMPVDPLEAAAALGRATIRQLDVVRVSVEGREQWLINAAAGGNAAEVSRRIDAEQKRRWGPWCFVRGVVDVAMDLKDWRLRVSTDDEPPAAIDSFAIILANGRTIGTMEVANRANLEDGKLEVIVIRQGPLITTAGTAAEFFTGDYLQSEQIDYRRARRVRVESDDPVGFSIDGEQHWGRWFEFTVHPAALPAAVGRQYFIADRRDTAAAASGPAR